MRDARRILPGYAAALFLIMLAVQLAAPGPVVDLWTGSPRFAAASAYGYAAQLAEGFPYRPAGSPGAARAAEWLVGQFAALGLRTGVQRGSAVLAGRRVPLRNVYALSPGRSPDMMLIVANYDMAPTSYQAASDTAGGVGVLLELARIFAREPHQKTMVFLAPDGEEWGLLGARLFAFHPPLPGRIVAAVLVEDLASGRLQQVIPTMTGQHRGYTPPWLRELTRRATLAEGLRFVDPPSALEYADRGILVPATDQGPFLAAGIPSIEPTTQGDEEDVRIRNYHLPGDVMALMWVGAFHTFGRIAERIVRSIDAMPLLPRGGAYLRLSNGRIVQGWPLLAAQVGIFLPLLAAAVTGLHRRAWFPGLAEAVRRFLILGGLYGAVILLPRGGLLPLYELYPPPPRHPLLSQPDLAPFLVLLLVLGILILVARGIWRPPALAPGDRRAGALLALSILALAALWQNPFAATTFLLLPVWLWVWVEPGARPRLIPNVLLLMAGWTVHVVLILVQTTLLEGANLPWYFLMAAAYGQFTPAQCLLTLGQVAVGTQFVQVALSRSAPRG